jgi:hypothetical protein
MTSQQISTMPTSALKIKLKNLEKWSWTRNTVEALLIKNELERRGAL